METWVLAADAFLANHTFAVTTALCHADLFTGMQTTLVRRGREQWSAACYCAILVWINVYIARDFFAAHTAHMNSMHGFWIAMAKRAGSGWFHPTWWPTGIVEFRLKPPIS